MNRDWGSRINDLLLWLIAILMLAMCQKTFGADYFVLRKAAIEGGKYAGTNHNYFLELDRPGEQLQHTTKMLMNIDLLCISNDNACIFWNNLIDSKATNQQYRYVAWNYRLGLSLGKHIEMGWHHISEHELDRKSSDFARFGLENVLFVEFKWYENPRKPK